MFYLNKETELTAEILQKMIETFNVEVAPKRARYKKYYDGLHKILNKSYSDETKPCNKTVTNYCKNIADSYCGYLASPSYITYSSDRDIAEIMEILKYNDYQTEDSDFLLDALVYGVSYELMYLDEDAKTRFRLINPSTCFGIYDDTLCSDLLYFVRMYKASTWTESELIYVDVYSDYDIRHYKMDGELGTVQLIDVEAHYFQQCPANIFYLPDEKSIFDCIMGLQDSYNALVSSEIDDYEAFCDAYLALIGVSAEPEDVVAMKQNRVFLLPEDAKAEWITKNASDAQIENILKRTQDSIYKIAQCPDFSSETFVGGVSSGIAIRYRLTGMETRAAKICANMKKALQHRIEIICGIASLKIGEEEFKDINIDFKRNIPEDITTIINAVNSLKGSVSDKTLLSQIPFVNDVDAELEQLEKEKKEKMEAYGLPSFHANEEDEDEAEGE